MRIYTLLPLVHTYTSHTCLCMSIKSQIYARDFHINALLSVCLCPTHTQYYSLLLVMIMMMLLQLENNSFIIEFALSHYVRPSASPIPSHRCVCVCVFIVCMHAQAISTDFDLQPPQVHNECSAKK